MLNLEILLGSDFQLIRFQLGNFSFSIRVQSIGYLNRKNVGDCLKDSGFNDSINFTFFIL